ncbi:MAG TPA: DNA polymerase II [Steroidobacteraceae bacterium]|nr:DNA polymerase II [Steroidobacteraceae bacterium]
MIGFILQASYRVHGSRSGRVPVVHLHGKLENGTAFLVRDDRPRPHFFIREADGEAAGSLGVSPCPESRRTFAGEPVARVEVEIPSDVPPLRDRLIESGIETFEADVRFATRYLIERGIKGGCNIEGIGQLDADGVLVFHNPELTPAEADVRPRVLSFDIETDPKGLRLLAISMYGDGLDEVLIVDGSQRDMPARAVGCESEHAALTAFCRRVRDFDPDVLTGWNIVDFDLTVLEKIAQRVGHPLSLGRHPGEIRIRKPQGYFGSGQASVPGRLVLDGIDLMRGAFIRQDEYSLDFVARAVLGEGKALAGAAGERIQEIVHNYRHDLPAFARYSRTDARLAFQIVAKLKLVELAIVRSRLTGMTPDRVAASIASFDFLYLTELERAGIVAPSVRGSDSSVHAAQQGGHVLEPQVGLHANVWVFDFKSLYPSIIRTFNIDPVSYEPAPRAGDDLIDTPGGKFRREPAILPRLLDRLFPQREAAKRRGDGVAAHAIKILMNSFYGVLGTPACRFYNPALANAITGMGKEMLLWSKRWFEAEGYTVLYGDTDSLFIGSRAQDPSAAESRARDLVAALNADLERYVAERWRVASRLELEFEKLYLRLFLPHARHSTRGASKRYAGLLHGERQEVEFVGMEVVRRDWTPVAKRVQRELYQRLFTGQPVEAYLADIVRDVRAGKHDAELVYQKSLRRSAAEYTETTPPHVAAARKVGEPGARSIRYVMTTAGAEPAAKVEHSLDREHYVAKQIRPVAESVLEVLGLDFDRVIGDMRQFELGLG